MNTFDIYDERGQSHGNLGAEDVVRAIWARAPSAEADAAGLKQIPERLRFEAHGLTIVERDTPSAPAGANRLGDDFLLRMFVMDLARAVDDAKAARLDRATARHSSLDLDPVVHAYQWFADRLRMALAMTAPIPSDETEGG